MYPKQLFYKVLDLVDDDIAEQFRSIPEEPFKDEEKFPTWDLHDPMRMQMTRDLKKIAQTINSGCFKITHNCNNSVDDGCKNQDHV